MVLMFLSIPMTFLLSPKQDKNIVNKIWYCLHSSTESENGDGNYNLSQIDFNKSYIDKYKKLYPNRKIINDHYPLERIDNINNVLGSYFNEADNVFYACAFNFDRISDFLHTQEVDYMSPFKKECDLAQSMKERMETIQYIDYYTYTRNCITNSPIIPSKKYELIESISIDSAFCASGKEKPSIYDVKNVDIFSSKIKAGYSDIKVIFTADLKYTADVHHQHFINMNIKCNNSNWYPDVISKNIVEKDYRPEEWLKLEITKTFDIENNNKGSKLHFYLSTPKHDHYWNPEHTVLLKNINILGVSVNS